MFILLSLIVALFPTDEIRKLYIKEVQKLEVIISELETKLRQVQESIDSQTREIDLSLESAKAQNVYLQKALQNVPSDIVTEKADLQGRQSQLASHGGTPGTGARQKSTRGINPSVVGKVERRYISEDEFDSVSSYMKGRLSAEKVNAALDELAGFAEQNAVLVLAARKNKTAGYDRKHAIWLHTNISHHSFLKGKFWALEADLKAGTALKLDKSGKSCLTILRHLKRIGEVRIQADGSTHIVYSIE